MNEEPNKPSESLNVYALIALYAGLASVAIAGSAFTMMRPITDGGMWAIAAMVAAPAVMGIGIALFMSKRPSQ
ncbi:MAG TPA: hypothetical protein VK815_04105 [Candidatus Acidoferrales bacterium]|jgi:hypothetical protein|nr:hypothetical protein [Candidatus Acidoferrales bacterium]